MFEGLSDPFSTAAWGTTAAQNPGVLAQLFAQLGIPPPNMGGAMPAPNMSPGMALGGPLPQNVGSAMPAAPEGFSLGIPGGDVQGANDPAGTYAGAPAEAAAGGGMGKDQMAGLANLGRMLTATKQGSADVKPVFSGGITQAGRPADATGIKGGQQSVTALALQQLLNPKPAMANIPSLGMLLGGGR